MICFLTIFATYNGGGNPISFLSTYMEDLLRYKSQVVNSSRT